MHALATRLFPICRSLTGDGVRQTLQILQEHLPGLNIHEVPSGTPAFDWVVPEEWNIKGARLTGPDGEVIADFKDSNLHVLGYSTPVDLELSLEELQPHLHSLADHPTVIPYITSYYKRTWGFCIPHQQHQQLKPGKYRAVIDSTLKAGNLTYGELIIPGETTDEILLSAYICHPSMANNELSGPVVATWLAKYLQGLTSRRYTYRFVFIPETIGSLIYLSKHLDHLKKNVKAGFVLTCLGDDRAYSYMPSRLGDTLADKVALHTLTHKHPGHVRYTYLQRGSDERNYCWPGVDLPVCSIMRTRYGSFPEYHTSADDLSLITESGLQGGLDALRTCLNCLEKNRYYQATTLGEPQLSKRDLYPTTSVKNAAGYYSARLLVNIMAYCDGNHDLLDIANILNKPAWELFDAVQTLLDNGLLRPVK
nr:DUF4910 domain-containing protein [Prosthecobacter fusiformis]